MSIDIKTEYEFETVCCNIAKERYGDAQKYGRRGQNQSGIDIICKDRNTNEIIVIQCKFKYTPIKSATIIKELESELVHRLCQ